MPGKSGIETAVEIGGKYPGAKFILMSGCDWYGIDLEFFSLQKSCCTKKMESILSITKKLVKAQGFRHFFNPALSFFSKYFIFL